MLPDLCQRALNASHGATSRSSELEIMRWISEYADGDNLAEITEAARANAPMCASYIDKVAGLTEVISGGVGAPILHFMYRVTKTFGENKILGEEPWD